MSTKNVELHTCDSCKTLILLGRGGVCISGGERVTVKWVGGFQDLGTIAKGHAPPPYPTPTGTATGPLEGIDQRPSVSLCRKCLAHRLGFRDDSDPPADPTDPAAPDRFHREPV